MVIPPDFDPNAEAAEHANIFGLPTHPDSVALWILPVPWDASASYHKGTALSPQCVFDASMQVDLFDEEYPDDPWRKGIFMFPPDAELLDLNRKTNDLARSGCSPDQLTPAFERMNQWVEEHTNDALKRNKKIILQGGEHAVSLGYYRALAKYYPGFGIVHLDAHFDLRPAYEHIQYSHASIMYNILHELPQVKQIFSLGLRDFCAAEFALAKSEDRVHFLTNRQIAYDMLAGRTFADIVAEIVCQLPPLVALSIDVDALDYMLAPSTGTPVPGGFSIVQLYYLLSAIRNSGRTIIGADLVEVGYSPLNDWDANVAARILFKLANTILSQ